MKGQRSRDQELILIRLVNIIWTFDRSYFFAIALITLHFFQQTHISFQKQTFQLFKAQHLLSYSFLFGLIDVSMFQPIISNLGIESQVEAKSLFQYIVLTINLLISSLIITTIIKLKLNVRFPILLDNLLTLFLSMALKIYNYAFLVSFLDCSLNILINNSDFQASMVILSFFNCLLTFTIGLTMSVLDYSYQIQSEDYLSRRESIAYMLFFFQDCIICFFHNIDVLYFLPIIHFVLQMVKVVALHRLLSYQKIKICKYLLAMQAIQPGISFIILNIELFAVYKYIDLSLFCFIMFPAIVRISLQNQDIRLFNALMRPNNLELKVQNFSQKDLFYRTQATLYIDKLNMENLFHYLELIIIILSIKKQHISECNDNNCACKKDLQYSQQDPNYVFLKQYIAMNIFSNFNNDFQNPINYKNLSFRFIYFSFLVDVFNMPVKALIEKQQLLTMEGKKTLRHQCVLYNLIAKCDKKFNKTFSNSLYTNKVFNISFIFDYEQSMIDLRQMLRNQLINTHNLFIFLNQDVLSHEQFINKSLQILNDKSALRKLLYNLFKKNPNDQSLQQLTQLFIEHVNNNVHTLQDFIKIFQNYNDQLQQGQDHNKNNSGDALPINSSLNQKYFSPGVGAVYISLLKEQFGEIQKVSQNFELLLEIPKEIYLRKTCNNIMPKCYADQHDNFLKIYKDRVSMKFKLSIELKTFFIKNIQTGFICPITKTINNCQLNNSFGICALIEKIDNNHDFILSNYTGQVQGITRSLYQAVFQKFYPEYKQFESQCFSIYNLIPMLSLSVIKNQNVDNITTLMLYPTVPQLSKVFKGIGVSPKDENFLKSFKNSIKEVLTNIRLECMGFIEITMKLITQTFDKPEGTVRYVEIFSFQKFNQKAKMIAQIRQLQTYFNSLEELNFSIPLIDNYISAQQLMKESIEIVSNSEIKLGTPRNTNQVEESPINHKPSSIGNITMQDIQESQLPDIHASQTKESHFQKYAHCQKNQNNIQINSQLNTDMRRNSDSPAHLKQNDQNSLIKINENTQIDYNQDQSQFSLISEAQLQCKYQKVKGEIGNRQQDYLIQKSANSIPPSKSDLDNQKQHPYQQQLQQQQKFYTSQGEPTIYRGTKSDKKDLNSSLDPCNNHLLSNRGKATKVNRQTNLKNVAQSSSSSFRNNSLLKNNLLNIINYDHQKKMINIVKYVGILSSLIIFSILVSNQQMIRPNFEEVFMIIQNNILYLEINEKYSQLIYNREFNRFLEQKSINIHMTDQTSKQVISQNNVHIKFYLKKLKKLMLTINNDTSKNLFDNIQNEQVTIDLYNEMNDDFERKSFSLKYVQTQLIQSGAIYSLQASPPKSVKKFFQNNFVTIIKNGDNNDEILQSKNSYLFSYILSINQILSISLFIIGTIFIFLIIPLQLKLNRERDQVLKLFGTFPAEKLRQYASQFAEVIREYDNMYEVKKTGFLLKVNTHLQKKRNVSEYTSYQTINKQIILILVFFILILAIYPIGNMKMIYDLVKKLQESKNQIHLFHQLRAYNLDIYANTYLLTNFFLTNDQTRATIWLDFLQQQYNKRNNYVQILENIQGRLDIYDEMYDQYKYFMRNIIKSDSCNFQFNEFQAYLILSYPNEGEGVFFGKNCLHYGNGVANQGILVLQQYVLKQFNELLYVFNQNKINNNLKQSLEQFDANFTSLYEFHQLYRYLNLYLATCKNLLFQISKEQLANVQQQIESLFIASFILIFVTYIVLINILIKYVIEMQKSTLQIFQIIKADYLMDNTYIMQYFKQKYLNNQ